jgi:CBS domain-containing protein
MRGAPPEGCRMEREKHIADRKVGDVRHLVVPNASTVRPDQSVDDLLRIMIDDPCTRHVYVVDEMARILLREKITELPVVDADHRLVGQINMYEVIAGHLNDTENEHHLA